MPARGDPDHAAGKIVIELETLGTLPEQADEPARDVAEADKNQTICIRSAQSRALWLAQKAQGGYE